jgi:hypothetical protein
VKKRDPKEYESAGKFAVGFGFVGLILAIFYGAALADRLRLAAPSLMLLGWGSRQLASVRKRKKRESECKER